MAWYLPGILKDSRQVGQFVQLQPIPSDIFQSIIMVATEKLHPLLKIPTSTSWQADPKYYHSETQAPTGSVRVHGIKFGYECNFDGDPSETLQSRSGDFQLSEECCQDHR